ncbi:MAG TPA: ribonuclease P protein component [Terriglobales bacterium]|nr:ribonuclease P protein component [Terriglobales bacterium]
MNGPPPHRQSPSQPGTGGKPAARFPRAARLLRHADFERVYKQGQRHFARHMTLFFLPRAEPGSRVGFTVGRVLGGAVERNRIKRRLREAVRRQRARLRAGVDVVVNPKKSVQGAEFTEILEEFRRAFDAISAKLRSGSEGTS